VKVIHISSRLGALLRLVREDLKTVSKVTDSSVSVDSACPAVRLAASQISMAPKPQPSVPSGSGSPHVNLQCSEVMEISDNLNESQRKRQLTDVDGFVHPPKSKTAKAGKVGETTKPVLTKNSFGLLSREAAQAGCSKDSSPVAAPKVKVRQTPPIMAKVVKVDAAFVNAVKAQTSGLVSFEYTGAGLKIRPGTQSDHTSVVTFLRDSGVEFYTFNPNPEQQIRYVLRGLPPSTDSEEVIAGLREKGVVVSHARQIKRNVNIEGVRTTTLLPLWVVTILKTEENITLLKKTTGILNFVIKIQDYRATNRVMQCFRCQGFGHKADFCNIKDCCVKCAGDHQSRTCTKDSSLPAKCANCQGDHSANYGGCPEAKKYQERRGRSRAPQPQPQRKPNVSSTKEFPALPRKQRVERPPPTPPPGDGMGDLKEIIALFTSGTVRTYITKFKSLIGNVRQQPDSMSKMLTFCFGLMELFD